MFQATVDLCRVLFGRESNLSAWGKAIFALPLFALIVVCMLINGIGYLYARVRA